jgi:hypothetical protein
MLASMLQRRGSSDELDDEIFKNALSTNYLGMSSLATIIYLLTLDVSRCGNGKQRQRALDPFLELYFVFRFNLLYQLHSFASRFTPTHRNARRRKLTESWEENDYPLSRTGPLYLT